MVRAVGNFVVAQPTKVQVVLKEGFNRQRTVDLPRITITYQRQQRPGLKGQAVIMPDYRYECVFHQSLAPRLALPG